MNKDEIIQTLRIYDLPTDQYWILAGSAMVMHDIRQETRDIDIGCHRKLFESLMKAYPPVHVWEDGMRSLEIEGCIEVFENWFVEAVEMIDELPVASLESIKLHKKALGREKDLKDLKLIEAYELSKVGK